MTGRCDVHPGRELTFATEWDLLQAAELAYEAARCEVFDVVTAETLPLSPRQQRLLVELERADDDLRRFREARRQGVA
jgi:hypothetical protein